MGDDTLKRCPRCDTYKERTNFHKHRQAKDGLFCWCRDCAKRAKADGYKKADKAIIFAKRKKWYECNKTRVRTARLQNRYNLSPEQHQVMLVRQNGACAICKEVFTSTPRVDHDHKCCPERTRSCGSCIRGLLCESCNFGIGKFYDNALYLRNAAEYLESENK